MEMMFRKKEFREMESTKIQMKSSFLCEIIEIAKARQNFEKKNAPNKNLG